MKPLLAAATASLFLSGCSGAQEAAPPAPVELLAPSTPVAIVAPSDQVVLLKAGARGAQIYVCKAKADDAARFEWSLKAPEAELTDDKGTTIGKHYAGPTWEAADGSKVVGEKKAQANGPDAEAIPWLLASAKSHEGAGVMARVMTIQRVDTHGGKAPAEGCDAAHAGAEARVPYTATYYFHGAR